MKKVSEALDFRGIDHLQISGSAAKKSNTLELFQKNAKARVLLLNVVDESASGAYASTRSFLIVGISQTPITRYSYLRYWLCRSRRTMLVRRRPSVVFAVTAKVNTFTFIVS
jgi:hypothetical protein